MPVPARNACACAQFQEPTLFPYYMAEFRFHAGEFRWVMLSKNGPSKPWKVVVATAPATDREHSERNRAQVEWLADVNNRPRA